MSGLGQRVSEVTEETRPFTAIGVLRGLAVSLRPHQWVKNLLVFAAPVAAGAVFRAEVVAPALLAFTVFTLAASGTYLLNDVHDVESDRAHPVKRARPIAAGTVPMPVARVVGVAALVASVGVPIVLGSWGLASVIALYVVAATLYTLVAKRVPLFELAIVASGFVLRAAAGAVAAAVPVSQWFLIVTSFGALYLVTTKRYAELRDRRDVGTRLVLDGYSREVLQEIRFTAAAVTITAYVLWAFENAEAASWGWWFELSIVPFVLAIYRYAMAVHKGQGEAPEEILLGDRQLVGLGAVWGLLYGVGLYAS